MVNRHKKRCSTSPIIREMQIKTTLRYHVNVICEPPFRMAHFKKKSSLNDMLIWRERERERERESEGET